MNRALERMIIGFKDLYIQGMMISSGHAPCVLHFFSVLRVLLLTCVGLTAIIFIIIRSS